MNRRIHIYENPETSEISGEHLTLTSAMTHPPKMGAEIVCNGHKLAVVEQGALVVTPDGKDWTRFL